jgi:hypothetical protein
MKKLFLGLIATVMISDFSYAQIVKPANKIATSVVLVAKYHAVITFLESKDYYRQGITSEEFVQKGLAGVTDKKLISILTPYMQKIYSYHTQKYTADMVYDQITGSEFSSTVNSLRLYAKEVGSISPQVRIGWLNAIRKFFDWLDDTLGEIIDPRQSDEP